MIHSAPEHAGLFVAGEALSTTQKMLPVFGSIFAISLVFLTYENYTEHAAAYIDSSARLRGLYRFLTFKWGFDPVYNRLINQPLVEGAYSITFSLIDKGLLEVAGPTGLGNAAVQTGRMFTKVQTGRVYDYAAFLLAGLYLALVFTSLLPTPLDTSPLCTPPDLAGCQRLATFCGGGSSDYSKNI